MKQPVIKWSGSKRLQAAQIIARAPKNFNMYYEPFIGGGSVLYALKPKEAKCGDICEPLIGLWNEIKNSPIELAEGYRTRWERLQSEGFEVFYQVREHFNKYKDPEDLMFLSRTCVNGLIRFNSKGEFNNSLHHTRPGINPVRLKKIILDWSASIQSSEFVAAEYQDTTKSAKEGDFVYLDPPYFHTVGRYYGTKTINFKEFLEYLANLNTRGIKYMLSFDGKRADMDYTVEIPKDLYVRHEFIPSGNSSFKKVMDKQSQEVFESLYMNY